LSSSSDDVVYTGETDVSGRRIFDLTDDPVEKPPPPKKPRPYSSMGRLYRASEKSLKDADSQEGQLPKKTRVETMELEYTSKGEGSAKEVSLHVKTRREVSEPLPASGRVRPAEPSKPDGEPSGMGGGPPGMGGGSSGCSVGRTSRKSSADREKAFNRSGPQTFKVDLTDKLWEEALDGKDFTPEEINTIKRDVTNLFSKLKDHATYKDLLQNALRRDVVVQQCEDQDKGLGLFAKRDIPGKAIVSVPSGGTFYPTQLAQDALENGDAHHTFACEVYGKVNQKEYKLDGALNAKNTEIYRVNHGCPTCEANSNFYWKLINSSNVRVWLLCVQTMEKIEVEDGYKEILVSYNYDQTHKNLKKLYKEMPWAKCQKCHGKRSGK
jgi:hypothetical protein